MASYNTYSFDDIKEDLVKWFQSKTEFQDTNYLGSTITLLLEALAYDRHYNQVYSSMIVNESFLDTCKKRSSAVSKSKPLGYMPKQYSAARTVLKLSLTPANTTIYSPGDKIILPIGVEFSAINAENNTEVKGIYRFQTQKIYEMVYDGTTFNALVEAVEGTYIKETWTYAQAGEYKFQNGNLDLSYLQVDILPFVGATTKTTWQYGDKLGLFDKSSEVYFLQESYDGKIEIFFGDNIIAKTPVDGQIIQGTCWKTTGVLGNGFIAFKLITNSNTIMQVGGVIVTGVLTVETKEPSHSGGNRDDIEQIRLVAPRAYARQRRDVIAEDYATHLLEKYSWIQSISTWGGEDSVPPQYGRVFLCIKPKYGDMIPPSVKDSLEVEIKTQNVTGITPVFVDANIVVLDVTAQVTFSVKKSIINESDLQKKVGETIIAYLNNTISVFKSVFRYSKLNAAIERVDPSILSVDLTTLLVHHIIPEAFTTKSYTFIFSNKLVPGSVKTYEYQNRLTGDKYYLQDDGLGYMDHYINGTLFEKSIGTVTYDTGYIVLPAFRFHVDTNTKVTLIASTITKDVVSLRNTILVPGQIGVNTTKEEKYTEQ